MPQQGPRAKPIVRSASTAPPTPFENCFSRIKDWRRIATRYDKLARNFLPQPPSSPPSTGLEL